MSQPAQGTHEPKKGFNWTRLIMTVVFFAVIIILALWVFDVFKKSKETKNINEFKTRLTGSSTNVEDDHYFKSITTDSIAQAIYVEEVPSSGESESYVVYASPTFISQIYENSNQGGIHEIVNMALNGGQPNEGKLTAIGTPKNNSAIWSFISTFGITLLMIFGIMFFIKRANQGGGSGGIFGAGKNPAKKIISNKRFSDVAGQKEVKEEIEEVVDFLRNPKKYEAAGARIPKGIMLGGPPGTGKTLLAKATAGEANVPFYFISASNFVEMFAGMGAKRVREMFKEARKVAPAILFIDELDAVGRKRGSSLSGNDEREQTLNQILVEMDGMDENSGLLIIAATNRTDVLDPALLRPGRFDRVITVNNPDILEREMILELHAKGKRIHSEVDFKNVAKRTPGYSGAQLENVVNEAALLSVREKTNLITIQQIDEAIDRVVAGPAKKHRTITPEEMMMVAYHEAGHAIIGLKISDAEIVQKITIIPRGDAGGYTLMTPRKETYNYKKSELEAKIISYMGGRAAEQIIYGKGEVSTGAHNDIERATNIARSMVTQFGMSILGPIAYEKINPNGFLGPNQTSKDYSDALAEKIDDAIRELVVGAETKALSVIKENKKLLKLIADELLEKETIVKEEIDYIHENLKRLPAKKIVKKSEKDASLSEIINDVKKHSKK
ncbi:ATP-dependent zinc metalloprotease FtsH [Candidatus Mycoplasma mahonii]|uniref:ATP-dependent zinc metalloprotease FtsH n=1 Tax=Candidatus Mycoplasma mahonii TaxID=3004105 RepID=UPI0026F317AD|nr:ATP-dependent zinc metalloprotease FtsH [Candidatus Mycoplasma mahonii]WKX02431.1 ATP-dependent zinc metalloprotease FtsH [Candidatus Mycoplasma mahonii]